MKHRYRALMLAGVFTCACSSISKKQSAEPFPMPPASTELNGSAGSGDADPVAIDHALEKALRANSTEPMRYLVRYRQAKLWSSRDPAKACALWLEVAKNPRFPLSRVARIRAVETCPVERAEVTPYYEALRAKDIEHWLREPSFQAAREGAIRRNDKRAEMMLALELSPYLSSQSEQLKLIQRAAELAREHQDPAVEELAKTQIQKYAPRLIPDPPTEKYMAVAADFRRVRDFAKAREYYKRVIDGDTFTDMERLRALDGVRMTFKLEHDTERYLQATREYSDFARAKFFIQGRARNLAKYLETRLTLARAVWTENSAKEARSILRKLEAELKGRHPLDESYFLRARIDEESGRLGSTIQLLGRIDDRRINDSGVRSRIRWYRAWNLRKLGRWNEAAKILAALLEDEESQPIIARNRFWLGRTYKDAGQIDKASAEFKWLIENDPIGYYSTLAYRELQSPMPALTPLRDVPVPLRAPTSVPGTPSSATIAALSNEESLIFEWLIATGETEIGRRLLDNIGVARRAMFSKEHLLQYLQLYARAGAYHSLFARMADIAPETRREILDRNPELIFPQPWSQHISASARQFEIPPALIYSIMRQESSFNPRVRSHADAMGLMQLIPVVANETARSIGVDIGEPETLYKPDLNIMLGTAHLRELLKKWHGRFIPSVASYNANEKAVLGWLRTRDRRDPLQFIEDIPYEETRGYVKLVLRNFIFYSRLASNGAPVPFPEWCLDGLQDINP